MKTANITLDDVEYVISALNVQDATFITMELAPVIAKIAAAMASLEGKAAGDIGAMEIDAFGNCLSGLKRETYDGLVSSLFSLIKRKEGEAMFSIFKDGTFLYASVKSDAYLFLSLLKESFMLSFKDFLISAVRAFPSLGAAISLVNDSSQQA